MSPANHHWSKQQSNMFRQAFFHDRLDRLMDKDRVSRQEPQQMVAEGLEFVQRIAQWAATYRIEFVNIIPGMPYDAIHLSMQLVNLARKACGKTFTVPVNQIHLSCPDCHESDLLISQCMEKRNGGGNWKAISSIITCHQVQFYEHSEMFMNAMVHLEGSNYPQLIWTSTVVLPLQPSVT